MFSLILFMFNSCFRFALCRLDTFSDTDSSLRRDAVGRLRFVFLTSSYLNPKVLVSFSQESVHVLQDQLGGSVQQVKVQVESQQRCSIHSLQETQQCIMGSFKCSS